MERLETERLILRPFVMEDIDDFYEYCQMDTVGPNAGRAVHDSKEHSLKILGGFLEKGDVLAVYLKTENKVIGSVGLHKKTTEEGDYYYEIGYVLSTLFEGHGYMTEAVKRVLKYAFIDLDIKKIYVCHFVENKKSRRVIEKCGFEYLQYIDYETVNFGKRLSKLYHLTKDEFIKHMEDK